MKVGSFTLPSDWIRNEPEQIAKIFAMMGCVPVRAEAQFYDRKIHYIAIAECFEDIQENLAAPEYILEITRGEDGAPSSVVARNRCDYDSVVE